MNLKDVQCKVFPEKLNCEIVVKTFETYSPFHFTRIFPKYFEKSVRLSGDVNQTVSNYEKSLKVT